MKLQTDPLLPADPAGLSAAVKQLFRRTAASVNGIIEGRLSARDAFSAAPTAGVWAQGDLVPNSTPTEMGAAGSMYVVTHFICIASGTPGTWREARSLTGN